MRSLYACPTWVGKRGVLFVPTTKQRHLSVEVAHWRAPRLSGGPFTLKIFSGFLRPWHVVLICRVLCHHPTFSLV